MVKKVFQHSYIASYTKFSYLLTCVRRPTAKHFQSKEILPYSARNNYQPLAISGQFQYLAFSQPFVLYIFNGTAINNLKWRIFKNGRPISDRYFYH